MSNPRSNEPFEKSLLENIEIIRVQNGWIMRPATSLAHGPQMTSSNEMFVFQRLEDMTRWLGGNLEKHSESLT